MINKRPNWVRWFCYLMWALCLFMGALSVYAVVKLSTPVVLAVIMVAISTLLAIGVAGIWYMKKWGVLLFTILFSLLNLLSLFTHLSGGEIGEVIEDIVYLGSVLFVVACIWKSIAAGEQRYERG
jgi:hypothetical protein